MKSKLKIILATVACTTIGWGVVVVCFFLLVSSRDPDMTLRFPHPGHFESAELEIQKGEYVVEVMSSNRTTSAMSLLFSRTSRPPERMWFAIRSAER